MNEGQRKQASRGARGNLTLGIYFGSSLSQVSDLLRAHLMFRNWKKRTFFCPDHFPDFNLKSSIIVKNIFIMKNLTDFRKRVETGVNPNLLVVLSSILDYACKYNVASWFALGELGS